MSARDVTSPRDDAAFELRVRTANVDDIETLAAHRVSMFLELGEIAESECERFHANVVAYLATAVPSGEYRGWLAEVVHPDTTRGSLAGGAGVLLRTMVPRPIPGIEGGSSGPEALVLNVYTAPAWRRHGVAATLMRHILAWANDLAIPRLVLHASPMGRPMYEKLGFVATTEMRYVGSDMTGVVNRRP